MKRPLIGIMGDWFTPDKSAFDFDWVTTNMGYVDGLEKGGASALVVPRFSPEAIDCCDAILIQGGADVDPALYGQSLNPLSKGIRSEMDRTMINAVLYARSMDKPVFGICRGIQLINVALGGTLYQDVSLEAAAHKHSNYGTPYIGVHSVSIVSGTVLSRILGESELMVNSLHHQAVDAVADGLRVSAVADDKTIEALENADGSILAVQWHPEALIRNDERMKLLFEYFAHSAGRRIKV